MRIVTFMIQEKICFPVKILKTQFFPNYVISKKLKLKNYDTVIEFCLVYLGNIGNSLFCNLLIFVLLKSFKKHSLAVRIRAKSVRSVLACEKPSVALKSKFKKIMILKKFSKLFLMTQSYNKISSNFLDWFIRGAIVPAG